MNSNVTMGLRIVFGIFMLVFGLNKFLNFMPFPPIPGDGGTLMGIYFSSGFMKIIGVLEILGGLLLIAGKFVPLALTFMVAILFNAMIFHVLHAPATIIGAIAGMVMSLALVYFNRDGFKSIFSA